MTVLLRLHVLQRVASTTVPRVLRIPITAVKLGHSGHWIHDRLLIQWLKDILQLTRKPKWYWTGEKS